MERHENGGVEDERYQALTELEEWLERPMMLLGLVWLALLVLELTRGLNPVLEALTLLIWGLFVVDFLLRLVLAPRRLAFLRRNVLTVTSLVLPALRVLRIAPALRSLRFLRVARGTRLVRIVASLNRGMNVLALSLQRRGFGYVAGLTVLVTVIGAAGMYSFEPAGQDRQGFVTYGEALWWTAMLLTSIGSEYWPSTAEGRTLSLLLALYGLGVLGYITAILASFFVGRDAESPQAEVAGRRDTEELRREIRELREALEAATREDRGDSR